MKIFFLYIYFHRQPISWDISMTDVAGYELMVELKTTRRQPPNFPGAAFHNIVSTQ